MRLIYRKYNRKGKSYTIGFSVYFGENYISFWFDFIKIRLWFKLILYSIDIEEVPQDESWVEII